MANHDHPVYEAYSEPSLLPFALLLVVMKATSGAGATENTKENKKITSQAQLIKF